MQCDKCQLAFCLVRQVFRFSDTVVWSPFGGPNPDDHAFHSNSGGGALCTYYASELRWVSAAWGQWSESLTPVVYLAHPMSGDLESNHQSAQQWLEFWRRCPLDQLNRLVGGAFESRPVVIAPYLAWASQADDGQPGGREGILHECGAVVDRCSEVWVMVRASAGTSFEAGRARKFRDLTGLGPTPPRLEIRS